MRTQLGELARLHEGFCIRTCNVTRRLNAASLNPADGNEGGAIESKRLFFARHGLHARSPAALPPRAFSLRSPQRSGLSVMKSEVRGDFSAAHAIQPRRRDRGLDDYTVV
jgi:hypothetical protein